MNLLNNGPDNSLLSDGAKPQPDPMLTSHDINMLLCDSPWYKLWHMSMMKISLNEYFSKCHQDSMSKEIYRERRCMCKFYWYSLRQFYWIYNGYFHLKFKHVNKSHISFKGFIVNKSWRLFQMPGFFFLKYVVQCQVIGYAHLWLALPNAPLPGLRAPHAPFSRRWQPGKRKRAFVYLSNAIPPHSS